MTKTNKGINNDHFLSFIWLLFLILPNNQVFFIFVPIAFIVLFRFKNNFRLNVTLYWMILTLLLFLSVLFNINERYFDTKSASRVATLMIIFVSFGKLRGNHILSPYIYFAIGYLVISQFIYLINFTPLVSFFNNYYPFEGDRYSKTADFLQSYTMSDYGAFRLGGIFHNSNQYARYLELILLVVFCEIRQFSKKNLIIMGSLIVFSILATGSRTAFIVLCITIIYYLYSAKQLSLSKVLSISIAGLGILVFIYLNTEYGEFRVFQIEEGMDDSIGVKFNLFTSYINADPTLIKLLFGNLSGNALGQAYFNNDAMGMDSEIGNLFLCYGILFFIALFIFYITIFKRYLSKYRVVFTILIWMISSSILFSYRMAPLWFLVLGLYYRRSLQEKQMINQ
jgi:hypothetical protein